ncbi:tetratricopeptide repeat protein [Desulfonatronum parangueonense]
MFRAWIRSKRPEFVRDILRDFCLSQQVLENQFRLFDAEEHLEFEVLRDILGVEMNKGLLWRLKDTAHHLFRTDQDGDVYGQLLGWCLGYIFHEAMKLKEDAYQRESYGGRFMQLKEIGLSFEERHMLEELSKVIDQTRESMRREVARIRFIIASSRKLFVRYLPDHRDNALLARLLYDRNNLVRMVFAEEYGPLVKAMYGDRPELLYQLASQSLMLGGWEREAVLAEEEGQLLCRQAGKTGT